MQLGFTLMDAFGPKAAFGRPVETVNTAFLSPTQKACKVGEKILMDTFKVPSDSLISIFTNATVCFL
jgi:Fanconi anemia group I protein